MGPMGPLGSPERLEGFYPTRNDGELAAFTISQVVFERSHFRCLAHLAAAQDSGGAGGGEAKEMSFVLRLKS